MKHFSYIIISFLCLFLVSNCKKSEIPENSTNPNTAILPDVVTLDKIMPLLPQAMQKSSSVYVYKNSAGKEIRLDWKPNKTFHNKNIIPGHTTKLETIIGNLSNTENTTGMHLDFYCSLTENGSVYYKGIIWLNWKLYPELSPYDGLELIYDSDTEKFAPNYPNMISHTIKKDKVNLMGKDFYNVFQRGTVSHPHYQDFTFNFDIGIVAFRDISGDLYVFERNE